MFLPPPALDWRGPVPVDRRTGDIFYKPDDALGEVDAVFLTGIGAPQIWAGRDTLVIGETGFGTGLNFLRTWQRFQDSGGKRLHFVSVEGFPMTAADLARAHSAFPELSDRAARLRAVWPPPVQGVHRRRFGPVTLTLLFGEAAAMLADYEARVDAWFLDGFAPSQNPDMWSPALVAEITRLSAPSAIAASFTVAGRVREGLAAAGWQVAKHPGHGRKRQRLVAYLPQGGRGPAPSAPWYAEPKPRDGPLVILGGGAAGRWLAHLARQDGLDPLLVAADDGASAVPAGVRAPKLGLGDGLLERLGLRAWLHAQAAAPAGPLALLEPDAERFERLADRYRLLAPWLTPRSAADLSVEAGLDLIAPGFLCAGGALPALPEGPVHRARVTHVTAHPDGGARLTTDTGTIEAATLIFATGAPPPAFCPGPALDARPGRLFRLVPGGGLPMPLAYGGYAVPDAGGLWLGSSFERRPTGAAAARGEILAKLHKVAPSLALWAETQTPAAWWCGIRATYRDHLPIVGALFETNLFDSAYTDLKRDARWRGGPALPALPGLYALTGLGARGHQWAPLLAEQLVAHLTGAPWALERSLAEALRPVRPALKALRRA